MPFVKLDCGILNSSLWIDHDAREMFVTALLLARPAIYESPVATFNARNMAPEKFTVPAGEFGFVAAAGVGIANLAGVPKERALAALERLAEPETDSRTPDHEGRRMVRIDGGFLILNYAKYREQDRTNAERQARHRMKVKQAQAVLPDSPERNGSNGVIPVTNNASRSRVVAKATISDIPKGISSPPPPKAAKGGRVLEGKKIMELFHEICPTLPKVAKLTPERKKHVGARARAASADGEPLEWFRKLFTKAAASDFISGRAGSFRASFDWLMSPTNSQKVLEGNYDNAARQPITTDKPATEPAGDKFAGWGKPA